MARLVAAVAESATRVRLAFDASVVVADSTRVGFLSDTVPHVPIVAFSAEADGTSVRVAIDTEMSPAALYRVRATGIEDVAARPIDPAFDSASLGGSPDAPAGDVFALNMIPH
jgi:hypothetical protein